MTFSTICLNLTWNESNIINMKLATEELSWKVKSILIKFWGLVLLYLTLQNMRESLVRADFLQHEGTRQQALHLEPLPLLTSTLPLCLTPVLLQNLVWWRHFSVQCQQYGDGLRFTDNNETLKTQGKISMKWKETEQHPSKNIWLNSACNLNLVLCVFRCFALTLNTCKIHYININ